jgi:ribosomal protein L11 methyltransferase
MGIRRIVSVPFWETREQREDELLLRMNLGTSNANAFGFGAHQTTSLCLSLLGGLYAEGAPRPRRVLDMGCGTGILGIACARLGAAEVLGIDISEAAVALSRENAERNGAQATCRFELTPVAQVPGAFELVFANMPSSVIVIENAEALCARAAGGLLMMSGFKEDRLPAVKAPFESRGRKLRMATSRDGWCVLLWG